MDEGDLLGESLVDTARFLETTGAIASQRGDTEHTSRALLGGFALVDAFKRPRDYTEQLFWNVLNIGAARLAEKLLERGEASKALLHRLAERESRVFVYFEGMLHSEAAGLDARLQNDADVLNYGGMDYLIDRDGYRERTGAFDEPSMIKVDYWENIISSANAPAEAEAAMRGLMGMIEICQHAQESRDFDVIAAHAELSATLPDGEPEMFPNWGSLHKSMLERLCVMRLREERLSMAATCLLKAHDEGYESAITSLRSATADKPTIQLEQNDAGDVSLIFDLATLARELAISESEEHRMADLTPPLTLPRSSFKTDDSAEGTE